MYYLQDRYSKQYLQKIESYISGNNVHSTKLKQNAWDFSTKLSALKVKKSYDLFEFEIVE